MIPQGVRFLYLVISYHGLSNRCPHRPPSVSVLSLSTWTRPYFQTPFALILTAGSERLRRVPTLIGFSLLLRKALDSVSESSKIESIIPLSVDSRFELWTNAKVNRISSLAYAELYLTFAKIVRTFNMEVYDTTPEDLEVHHIRLTGAPKQGTGEIKVKITEKL